MRPSVSQVVHLRSEQQFFGIQVEQTMFSMVRLAINIYKENVYTSFQYYRN